MPSGSADPSGRPRSRDRWIGTRRELESRHQRLTLRRDVARGVGGIRAASILPAEDGGDASFTRGDGPLIREELTDDEYNALPTEMQEFVDTHHVGDTWTVSQRAAAQPPGDIGLLSTGSCPDSKNCDYFEVLLSVTTGVGFYDTTARTFLTSHRRRPEPLSLNQELTARHHDNNQEFDVRYVGLRRNVSLTTVAGSANQSLTTLRAGFSV